MKKHAADDREAALVTLLKRFYAGELIDGQLLRALRRRRHSEFNRIMSPKLIVIIDGSAILVVVDTSDALSRPS